MKLSERKAYVIALKKFREKVEQDLPATEFISHVNADGLDCIDGVTSAFYTKFEFLDFIDAEIESKNRLETEKGV